MRIKEQIGEINIDKTNKVIVVITTDKIISKVDIRNWFLSDEAGTWIATKRGISLSLSQVEILIRLLSLIDIETLKKEVKEKEGEYKKLKTKAKEVKIKKISDSKTYIP